MYFEKSLESGDFKRTASAFRMKKAGPKNTVKSNQILPIMQDYAGKSMLSSSPLPAYDLIFLRVSLYGRRPERPNFRSPPNSVSDIFAL